LLDAWDWVTTGKFSMSSMTSADHTPVKSQAHPEADLLSPADKKTASGRLKNVQQFLLKAMIVTCGVALLPAMVHLNRANDGINPIPVDGTRFEGNLGPVNVIHSGEFSRYVPTMRSIKIAMDAYAATPVADDQMHMGAQAYFASYEETGQKANGCVIRQYAKPTGVTSNIYLPVNELQSPTIMDRRLVDFVVPAHELNHCLYNVEDGVNITRQDDYDPQYFSSVMETAGDLGMILLYAQKTGTFDAFEHMMRLERRVGMSHKDQGHTTTWALDVILKDIDPQAMTRKAVPEIAAIVRDRMAHHFESQGYLTNPKIPGTPMTPAMQALTDEITAQRWLALEKRGDGCATPEVQQLIVKLKDDIQVSLANNHNRFYGELSDAEKNKLRLRAWLFVADLGIQYSEPKAGQGYRPAYDMPVFDYLN
jgi:hypothetical protein